MQTRNTGRAPAKKKRSEKPTWTLTEAKAKFSSLVDRALKGEPQRVVRGGREEVVIIDAATYEHVTRPKHSLVKLFSALRGVDIDLERPAGDTREAPKF